MKILVGNRGNIDFDAPVKMSTKQKDEFVDLMDDMFSVVEVHSTDYHRTERLGDRLFMREWTADEYRVLCQVKDINQICSDLGRTWMSVDIKLGQFIPQFLSWADKRHYDIVAGDVLTYIEEFMKEKEDEIIKRRKKKQAENRRLKQLRQKQKNLQRKIASLRLKLSCNQADPGDEGRIKEWEAQLANLEKQLAN